MNGRIIASMYHSYSGISQSRSLCSNRSRRHKKMRSKKPKKPDKEVPELLVECPVEWVVYLGEWAVSSFLGSH